MSDSASANAPLRAAKLPEEMRAFVEELGLACDCLAAQPLTGGVSSDIWLVETDTQRICIKRALPALRVSDDWQAPLERSAYEYAWFKRVQAIQPDSVPSLIGRSASGSMFAMAFLDPQHYPLWKQTLLQGKVDPDFAGEVGEKLARIHAATANDTDIAAEFASDDIFHAIRLEPYLLATARRHPDLAGKLEGLTARTAMTKRALVHGDVSPKNILIGPSGPVFLDAECAWYGDPAFDIAFCLNHLLLKSVVLPERADPLMQAFARLASHYLSGIDWEAASALEQRCASLLPALLLARIDGKSPVEYIVEDRDKARVRKIARRLILAPVARLAEVADVWTAAIRE
ncbi:MAG: aminoglycoside phosphotransferase family protein [Beijerinckiaceae bacterium]